MKLLNFKEDYIRIAKLENGDEVPYDLCSENNDSHPNFKYIGFGAIWTINGINQNSEKKYHFFKRK